MSVDNLGFQGSKVSHLQSRTKLDLKATSTTSSTTVDSQPENLVSDNNRERHQILKCVIRDELNIFDDSEIDFMLE